MTAPPPISLLPVSSATPAQQAPSTSRTEGHTRRSEPGKPATSRYKLQPARELVETDPIAWTVKGLLPTKGLALVYGPSGAGKSFLLLDLACAIAEGEAWFGRRVRRAPVVYLCLEGAAGFIGRVKAWQTATQRPLPELLHLSVQPFSLHSPEDVHELLRAVQALMPCLPTGLAGPVIIVDTLNRAMSGADENGSVDMGLSLNACDLLVERTGGLVVLAHHSGKDADRGPRGHSSLTPAVDASILVSRSGEKRRWKAQRVKDGRDDADGAFELVEVVLGEDEDGDEFGSCVVRKAEEGAQARLDAPRLSGTLERALLALHRVVEQVGADNDAPISQAAWRSEFVSAHPAASGSGKRNAVSRAQAAMTTGGYVNAAGEVLTLTPAGRRVIARLGK